MSKATSQQSTHELLAHITKNRSKGSPFGAALAQSDSPAATPDIEQFTPKPRNPKREAAMAKEPTEEAPTNLSFPGVQRRKEKLAFACRFAG